jgi:hypothetical protein
MTAVSKAASEAEVLSVAAYFSSLKPRKAITVFEADMVPKTYVAGWFLAVVNDKTKSRLASVLSRYQRISSDLNRVTLAPSS